MKNLDSLKAISTATNSINNHNRYVTKDLRGTQRYGITGAFTRARNLTSKSITYSPNYLVTSHMILFSVRKTARKMSEYKFLTLLDVNNAGRRSVKQHISKITRRCIQEKSLSSATSAPLPSPIGSRSSGTEEYTTNMVCINLTETSRFQRRRRRLLPTIGNHKEFVKRSSYI